jgi:hypothetical protein
VLYMVPQLTLVLCVCLYYGCTLFPCQENSQAIPLTNNFQKCLLINSDVLIGNDTFPKANSILIKAKYLKTIFLILYGFSRLSSESSYTYDFFASSTKASNTVPVRTVQVKPDFAIKRK